MDATVATAKEIQFNREDKDYSATNPITIYTDSVGERLHAKVILSTENSFVTTNQAPTEKLRPELGIASSMLFASRKRMSMFVGSPATTAVAGEGKDKETGEYPATTERKEYKVKVVTGNPVVTGATVKSVTKIELDVKGVTKDNVKDLKIMNEFGGDIKTLTLGLYAPYIEGCLTFRNTGNLTRCLLDSENLGVRRKEADCVSDNIPAAPNCVAVSIFSYCGKLYGLANFDAFLSYKFYRRCIQP